MKLLGLLCIGWKHMTAKSTLKKKAARRRLGAERAMRKAIWKHPDSGFYYSQEMAVYLLERGAGNIGCKSGANGRR